MYDNRFGQREGLRDRLTDWKERLGKDKTLPWVGLGLIADLQAAVDALDGKPAVKKPVVEFDL